MKRYVFALLASVATVLCASAAHADEGQPAPLETARHERLKAEFEAALAAGRTSHPEEEKRDADSYTATLDAVKSELRKLQTSKGSAFAVLRVTHRLLKLELQLSKTGAQQVVALSKHITLLRALETASDAETDRAMVQHCIARAERELAKRKAEQRVSSTTWL